MAHTHGPGESHSHSHSQPPPQQIPQPADPALQAIIEQDFKPVNLALADDNTKALCGPHKLEKCSDCNFDFVNLNRLSKLFVNNPTLLCPPPANVVSQNLTKAITTTKEEGNVCYSNLIILLFTKPIFRLYTN
jgi:translocation protein SEC72